MSSRKIDDLDPRLQPLAWEFAARMREAGLPFAITCTLRTQAEQDALYAQGRTAPGPVVTKVRHSKHNDGLAFDICILKEGKPCWDLKVSVDGDAVPDYVEAGKIGQALGLRWGGDWDGDGRSDDERFLDYPHFELPVEAARKGVSAAARAA